MWHWERNLTTASDSATNNSYALHAVVVETNLTVDRSGLDVASLHYYKVRVMAYGHPGLFSNRATIELPETGEFRKAYIDFSLYLTCYK